MIITIKTQDGTVMIDNFNRIESCPAGPCGMTGPCLDYRPRQQHLVAPAGQGVEISLFRDDVFVTTVISYQPVFVMNDQGQTVEKI